MKRPALAPALIFTLLCYVVAGTQLSLLAKADPSPLPINPIITIESLTNSTYNVNTLALNVTIKTIKTSFEGTNVAQNTTRVVSYSLDGKSGGFIAETSYSYEDSIFIGSAVLSELTEGPHNITVRAEYDYNPYGIHRESQSSVYFRIDTTPPFPTVLVVATSVASVAIVGAGLFCYFRKRYH